jgi:hypothetical protein
MEKNAKTAFFHKKSEKMPKWHFFHKKSEKKCRNGIFL